MYKKGLRAELNALRNPFFFIFFEFAAGGGDIAEFGLPCCLIQPSHSVFSAALIACHRH